MTHDTRPARRVTVFDLLCPASDDSRQYPCRRAVCSGPVLPETVVSREPVNVVHHGTSHADTPVAAYRPTVVSGELDHLVNDSYNGVRLPAHHPLLSL